MSEDALTRPEPCHGVSVYHRTNGLINLGGGIKAFVIKIFPADAFVQIIPIHSYIYYVKLTKAV